MHHYCHEVRCRLRVRCPALKGSECFALSLIAALL